MPVSRVYSNAYISGAIKEDCTLLSLPGIGGSVTIGGQGGGAYVECVVGLGEA